MILRPFSLFATFLSVATVVVVINVDAVVGDNSDVYSSTFEMSRLLTAEIKFVEALKTFAESNATFSDVVKTFYDRVYANFNPGKIDSCQCRLNSAKLILYYYTVIL